MRPRVLTAITVAATLWVAATISMSAQNRWGANYFPNVPLTTQDGKSYTAEIHGEFFMTLPEWSGYAKATLAQQQAWDAMVGKLRKHENEHVQIAYRNAQKLVKTLTNLKVEDAAQKIADSQQAGQDAQDDFDSSAKTDHGRNDFNTFPKVELDTSADPPPPPPKKP